MMLLCRLFGHSPKLPWLQTTCKRCAAVLKYAGCTKRGRWKHGKWEAVISLVVLVAFAAGCDLVVPSEQTLCHNMCAPRAVRLFVPWAGKEHPGRCDCDVGPYSDGGAR